MGCVYVGCVRACVYVCVCVCVSNVSSVAKILGSASLLSFLFLRGWVSFILFSLSSLVLFKFKSVGKTL